MSAIDILFGTVVCLVLALIFIRPFSDWVARQIAPPFDQ